MANKRTSAPIRIQGSEDEQKIIRNAVADHIRALDSNKRRAMRGAAIATSQGDNETAEAYESAQRAADRRIKAARSVQDRLA
jgi:hypothetical protein